MQVTRTLLKATAVVVAMAWGTLRAEEIAKAPPSSPLEPVAALAEFRLHPGYRIEIAAAEPQVVDPVAVRFDENGRMWVVEMGDYPNGPASGEPPRSRVRWLEDTDGDGRYETSRVFAQGLLFATGLQPWDDGLLVTVAGEVLFLADRDGDGVADVRETWYSGFKQENPQLRANHPTFAMDNRVYVANGLRGGVVTPRRSVKGNKVKAVSISGRDFRFDPRSGVCEPVNGNGQFGLTFDDLGQRFVCSNRNPCRHVVLAGRYLQGNPHLAVSTTMHDVVTPGAASRVFPVSRTWVTSTLHEGQFTAACGVTIYRGHLLGAECAGNAFICDPTGNLVHRERLSPDGATLAGKPGRKGVEFLASRDEWFRAVNLEIGPEGALYVVDMYRAVVEHPQWVPEELKNRPDNYAGNDRGRIYRIVPLNHVTAARDDAAPGLGRLAGEQLVAELSHPNGWRRDSAARLIYQRQDRKAIPALRRLAGDSKEILGRIHALWALDGLGETSAALVAGALAAADDRVVVQALILSESLLPGHPELLQQVPTKRLVSPELRLQYLLSQQRHPGWGDRKTAVPLVTAAVNSCLRTPMDSWTREAAVAGAGRYGLLFLTTLVKAAVAEEDRRFEEIRMLVRSIAETIGRRGEPREVTGALTLLSPQTPIASGGEWARVQLAGLRGLDDGLRRTGRSLGNLPESVDRRGLSRLWETLLAWLSSPASGNVASEVTVLLRSGPAEQVVEPLLKRFLKGDLESLPTLGGFGGKRIGELVLARYNSLAAASRREALDVLLADPGRTGLLLDAVVTGRIARADLDPGRVTRLRDHKDPAIRTRARLVLAGLIPAARQRVIQDYRPVLKRDGNPKRGREVFRKNCAACHRVEKIGVDVAPDIADSRRRTREQLLLSILDPNRAVDNNYFSYTVVTKAGKVLTGIVVSETTTAVTLRQAEGKVVRVLRDDIEVLKSNGISLMPEGLEKNITQPQMADLLNFLKNWRYLDGRVPIRVPGTGGR